MSQTNITPSVTSSTSHKHSWIMTGGSTWESASSTTTSSSGDCDTPTPSIMLDFPNIKDDDSSTYTIQSVEYHPKAGSLFMIRERQKPHRILSLRHGDLVLRGEESPALGWLWECVKKSGWYGFRNAVSGMYLGHNGKNKLQAAMPHHKSHEYFMAERHESGGYVLLTRHGEELWQVSISKNGDSLVEQKENGTAWDFVDSSDMLGVGY